MSKITKDKLEEFFDKRIKKQTGAEGWNLPSDDIFEAAMVSLDVENKDRKLKWILYFLTAVFVLTLSIFLYQSNLNKETANIAISESQELDEIPVEVNNENLIKEDIQKDVQIIQTKEEKQSTNSVNIESESNLLETVSQNAFTEGLTQEGNNSKLNREVIEEEGKELVKLVYLGSALVNKSVEQKILFVDEFVSLENKAISFLQIESRGLPETNFINPEMEMKTHSAPYALFVQGSLFQSSIFMKDIGVNNFTLEGYEKYNSGFSAGLGLQKAFTNKLKLEATFNWIHFSNSSIYTSEFVYDESNEFYSSNGELMYHNEMELSTPRAIISMNDDISMDNHMVSQDRITNKTEVIESYDVLQLGIGLNYELLRKGKLSIDLGVSPGLNYILNVNTNLNTILASDKEQMASYQSTAENTQVGNFNKIYFDAKASINLHYRISDNLKLRISGLYGQSLNSLKEYNSTDSAKSYFKTRSLSLGLAYSL